MIAFCTTCKGRVQHLKQTLPQNLIDNTEALMLGLCKFVIVDYGSPDDLVAWILAKFPRHLQDGHIVLYRAPDREKFQMAHAKNLAHRLGIREGGDVLVNLDADNFTGKDFAMYVASAMELNPERFLWSKVTVTDGSQRGISGRIVVTKEQFINAGGYDEKYNEWSPDDKDFNVRLRLMGYQAVEIDQQYLGVVLHNDKMRFKEYPHLRNNGDSSAFQIDPQCHVANAGRFGCGTVYRNFEFEPIELKPIPSRIFGIGMHKTATTSLHHALEILGFQSAHWKSAHWAKAIWREMTRTGCSPTLERTYATCDLPITMLFRQLDKAYPGSKFILTTRRADLWLETVRKHWLPEYNPFRSTWDSDPWTNRCHEILYGRSTFDAFTMITRYQRHNAEVIEYFKGREDLFVMDMDLGWPYPSSEVSWHPLCKFLDRPVPSVPYPRAFASY